MFFIVLGWFIGLVICCYLTVVCWLMAVNNLGTYNIGGVPNSFSTKFFTLAFYCFVGFLWYSLFKYGPFSIDINLPG